MYILHALFSKSGAVVSLMSVNELHNLHGLMDEEMIEAKRSQECPHPMVQRRTWVSEHNVLAIFSGFSVFTHTAGKTDTLTFKKHPS